MYRNLQPHGVMFHHFKGPSHPPGQGAISKEELQKIIEYVGVDRILPSAEFLHRAETQTLQAEDICLTFDDNLLCQYEVALPVLEEFGMTGFWFVYSSVFEGALERLELYRYFRSTCYDKIEEFYSDFNRIVVDKSVVPKIKELLQDFPPNYLGDFPFYTDDDRRFRYIRDEVLGPEEYYRLMDELLDQKAFNRENASKALWMQKPHIDDLIKKGHVVGLHSHTHPTRIERLDREGQKMEYSKNFDCLRSLTKTTPKSMSHPCNSYTESTLSILRELGITLGFRANMKKSDHGNLEYPRIDHANILADLKK